MGASINDPENDVNPPLRRTDDYASIRDLALRSGLEDGTFENIVAAFGYFADGRMVGCVALKQDGNKHSVEWLAVSDEFRGRGVGSMLVAKTEDEASARGAARIWALARAPRFFERIGFKRRGVNDSDGPTLSNCQLCSQFRRTCFPAVMVKYL